MAGSATLPKVSPGQRPSVGAAVLNCPGTHFKQRGAAFAILPGSYNINEGTNTYAGGDDLFPENPIDPNAAFRIGPFDVGFTANFTGRDLLTTSDGSVCAVP